MKEYINIHPNGVVIRSHNKKVTMVDHTLPGVFHIELTKKYDCEGSSVRFVKGRRNVNTSYLAISKETMEDLIVAYGILKDRVVNK